MHAPAKKLSHKEKISLSKTWLAKGILPSVQQKNVLYRKFIRTKDLTERKLLLQNFKIYKNTFHRFTRINRSDYYKHYFEEPKYSSKKTWDWIRSIISLKTNSHKKIRSINISNKTESNSKIMTETFNSYFVTIGRDVDSKIIHTSTSYKDYLQGSVLNSFFLRPAIEKEVISVINEMKTIKSTGPNSIPTKMLKISNKTICKLLTYLINLSFSNGIFPDLLKSSNIIPIFKREENQGCNHYQPIRLISNLHKLMEKVVLPRIYSFPEKNFLLFERQYGFQNKLSTNHVLIDIASKIQNVCDKGVFACSAYVDFKNPLILLIMSFYLIN